MGLSTNDSEAETVRADALPYPPAGQAWTTLGLLMAALVVSVMDRGNINLLVEPIKAHYGLSDAQFGALQGIAFGTFYVLASIPLGVLADRYQRRFVIGAGVTIFSLSSIGTGLARNYPQLFLSRMGVGFGEASVSPAGFALISDYFPPGKLGRASSLFNMSNFIGASLSLAVGGLLIGMFDRMAAGRADGVMGLEPWQATVICIALPGLILAPFLFLIREPLRRGLVGARTRLSLREVFEELGKRRLFLVLAIAAMSMASLMTNAVSAWQPALFIRVYGWSPTQVGVWLGMSVLAGAVIGSILGGWITDRMTSQNRLDAPLLVSAISFVGVGLFGVAAPLMPSGELALALILVVFFLKPMAFALFPMSLQLVIPNQLRTQTTALYFTVINLVGLTLGPWIVGLMTDLLFTEPSDVRYSMVIITAVTVPLMVVLTLAAMRPFRKLREEDRQSS